MILFCDTSALVKLYIVEPQSDQMNALVAEAEAVAVVRIAWAGFHAALARRTPPKRCPRMRRLWMMHGGHWRRTGLTT